MRFLSLAVIGLLAFPACDLLELPPDVPPPDGATHPYGEGNGKVVFLSDLADAQQIDVTLGGEPIGAVTRFSGCPGRITDDENLATAIVPAGTYQYTARSTTGIVWGPTTITVDEDEASRLVLTGRPSQYAVHVPDEIEGFPASVPFSADEFNTTIDDPDDVYVRIYRPQVAQGDRIDVIGNGVVLARGLLLGTSTVDIPVPLTPGPNYVAVRLSSDVDGDGTTAHGSLFEGERDRLSTVIRPRSGSWSGYNVRYAC